MRSDELRDMLANKARSFVGAKQGGDAHKAIIDAYNKTTPLPRGYKMTTSDAWCAAFVSSLFNMLGFDPNLFPRECSCGELIKLAKQMGIWVEDDTYKARVGDLLLYDWQDGTDYYTTDNVGAPDHIGIITMTMSSSYSVVEGNKHRECGVRVVPFNGRYIRGYITPDYDKAACMWTISKTDQYREVLKNKVGLADVTIDYLLDYKYGEELVRRLAQALEKGE